MNRRLTKPALDKRLAKLVADARKYWASADGQPIADIADGARALADRADELHDDYETMRIEKEGEKP
ncbi:MAG TPA: hypothetical protein VGO93_10195 [Candidatus Xenobia bacterium]|jgi:hypothetical protein